MRSEIETNEQRIAQEEQRLLEELKQLNNEMNQSSELIEPFSQNSADKIKELSESEDYKDAKNNIQNSGNARAFAELTKNQITENSGRSKMAQAYQDPDAVLSLLK